MNFISTFGYSLPGIMASVQLVVAKRTNQETDGVGQMCVVSDMIQLWLMIINLV